MIRLIAALDAKGGIATESGIPWKLPADGAHFYNATRTGLILMGWVTYTEFASPLHDRDNYVISREPSVLRDGFHAVGSLEQLARDHPDHNIWVIGGAGVFAKTIDMADELLLTQVLSDFNCTKFFPPVTERFGLVNGGPVHHNGGIGFRFETWKRRPK